MQCLINVVRHLDKTVTLTLRLFFFNQFIDVTSWVCVLKWFREKRERERERERLIPSSFTPPLPAHICCWGDDSGTLIQRGAFHALKIPLRSMADRISVLWEWKWTKISSQRVFMFTFSFAELLLSLKLGVMSHCWCRQVLLGVELGMLVAVLVAGSSGQIHDRREAGSSCYGGFDLYFVLDKWVLLPLHCRRRL